MIDEKRAKKYCSEDISKIENYNKAIADKTQTWDCHHRLEIQGQFRNSSELLKKCGLYDNVPAWQLIFLTPREHRSLHTLGKLPWNKGKIGIYSDETLQKMSEVHTNISDETRQKMRKAKLGKQLSIEHKQKLREIRLDMHWWNNGVVNKLSKDCPGPEWRKGRL